MDFKNVDKKYRPVPFWSWNEKLTTEQTKWQIDEMNDVGIGGFMSDDEFRQPIIQGQRGRLTFEDN